MSKPGLGFRYPISGNLDMRTLVRRLWLAFLAAGSLAAGEAPPAPRPEVQQVERGLRPAVLLKGEKPWTLEERMRVHNVPAVSIAVFGSGKILWAKAYGSADADALTAATDATLFQAASISKPVSAMAALKKVEQGKLALDRNINEYLKTWKLPENDLTRKTPVTLAELLSHSAGVTVHGFPGYAAGRAVQTLLHSTAPRPRTRRRSAWTFHPGRSFATRAAATRSYSRR